MFPRRTHPSSDARITSPKNPLVREIRKAVDRGALTTDGLAVAEGFHLLDEARRSGVTIEAILAAESVAHHVRGDEPLTVVPDHVLTTIASTETAQGVIALVRPARVSRADLFRGVPLILVLDGIQDPGNAGTLIRAAEAFGASGVVLAKGTVNAWNTKTIRASAGSVFRVPIFAHASPEMLFEGAISVQVWATIPRSGVTPVEAADLIQPCAVVIGSEAKGVSSSWSTIAKPITIPTRSVESLNAAVAGSIILYEAFRQRMGV